MPTMTRRAGIIGGASFGLASWMPKGSSAQSGPLTKLTFALDFVPLGRHAPWYAAVGAGYFRDAGLDVTIIPSQGTAQVIQAVDSGLAQLGFIDVPGLILARAAGSKIRMLAVNYQKAPYAIFSLSPGAAVTSPEQLQGLKLGSGAGSFTPKVIQGYMAQKGLDPQKLEIVNIAPPARANMLLSNQVPAIEFFVMAKPGLEQGAKAAKSDLKTFVLGDHGLGLYANGIAATEDFVAKNPEVVKRFVAASLRGWKLALSDPKQAAKLQKEMVSALKEDVIEAELGIVRDLAVTAETQKNGLGSFDPGNMQANLDFVAKYIGIQGATPKVEDLYLSGFLPSPPVLP